MAKFELSETQSEKLKVWQGKIKELFGEYGEYTFKFTPTGIGDIVVVESHLTKTELELTELENW